VGTVAGALAPKVSSSRSSSVVTASAGAVGASIEARPWRPLHRCMPPANPDAACSATSASSRLGPVPSRGHRTSATTNDTAAPIATSWSRIHPVGCPAGPTMEKSTTTTRVKLAAPTSARNRPEDAARKSATGSTDHSSHCRSTASATVALEAANPISVPRRVLEIVRVVMERLPRSTEYVPSGIQKLCASLTTPLATNTEIAKAME
jgi:hypothetical protein